MFTLFGSQINAQFFAWLAAGRSLQTPRASTGHDAGARVLGHEGITQAKTGAREDVPGPVPRAIDDPTQPEEPLPRHQFAGPRPDHTGQQGGTLIIRWRRQPWGQGNYGAHP